MTHDLTTNARILPASLHKLRQLKQALGFKTMYHTVEYVVNRATQEPAHMALLLRLEEQNRLDAERSELQAQLRG
jgi:hypothetical protein